MQPPLPHNHARYNTANRPITAADSANGITYASDFQAVPSGCIASAVCYTPQGTVYALAMGQSTSFTGLNLTQIFNNRLQPQEFKASSTGGNAIDIAYNFLDASNHNAGHVYGITNNLDTTRSQTFAYDPLNRIVSAQTTSTYATSPSHCWGEAYSLDAWGNLQSVSATTNTAYTGCTQESGFSATADGNNHLSGFGYDAAGNTTSDGTVAYVWDGESQLKSAGGVTYLYDGDGRRVAKAGSKLYWYGSGGEILAETDASGNTQNEYIFFGGKRIAMLPAGSTPIYYVEDMLGSSRVITTNTGVVCYDADFYPFGGERTYTNACPQNYKFEGKERDAETGNDDFGARYYSNRFGRWLSADWSNVPVPVPYANLTNPQTLNLYAMVADDPESFADLDGHVFGDNSNGGCEVHGLDCGAIGKAQNDKAATDSEKAAQNQWRPENGCQIAGAICGGAQNPPPVQPQPNQNRLTPEEQRRAAAVAYSENTRGTQEEHEAIISVIVNRANSSDHQYVNRRQAVNVLNVIDADNQFQGVNGRNFQALIQGRANNQGTQNAAAAAANISQHGSANNATAFIVTRGRAPTQRQVNNLGNVHPVGRVGNVFLFAPGPAPQP